MKKAIRKILNLFGYDFMKVPRTSLGKKEYTVNVQRFELVMPVNNPLRITYAEQPDFATEIGRLALCVHEKYRDFIFLDVGANTGDTVAIVKSVLDIPVISVEGDDFSFSYLKRNTGRFKNVTLFNNFLGEKKESLPGSLQKKGWNTTIIPGESGGATIELITLDELLQNNLGEQDIQKIKLLKIDTEGFDTIILRGAWQLLGKARPVIFLEYNRDNMHAIREDGLSTLLRLEELGYKKVLFYDDRGRYILSTDLSNTALIKEMHNYADGKSGLIYYYNICFFHEQDTDVAAKTALGEANYKNGF